MPEAEKKLLLPSTSLSKKWMTRRYHYRCLISVFLFKLIVREVEDWKQKLSLSDNDEVLLPPTLRKRVRKKRKLKRKDNSSSAFTTLDDKEEESRDVMPQAEQKSDLSDAGMSSSTSVCTLQEQNTIGRYCLISASIICNDIEIVTVSHLHVTRTYLLAREMFL